MLGCIKKIFIGLSSFCGSLASMANAFNFATCISLNNWPCMTWATGIDLNPNEYNQGLRYYPFIVNLDRCIGSCNSLDDPSGRICVPNRTEDINLSIFNVIARINKSKTLTRHMPANVNLNLMVENVT